MIGGILALVMTLTKPVVDTADGFLAKLGSGKVSEAYESTHSGLKATTPEADFASFVSAARLDQFASSSWSNRSIKNNVGRVEGTVTLRSGESFAMTIVMLSEGDQWKVETVNVDPAAMQGAPATPEAGSTAAPQTETVPNP